MATALAITERFPGSSVVVIEKEPQLAFHQTGNNSGVMHAGIYYKPGSLKATFCREGNAALREFCDEHGIAYRICGKLIVATDQEEVPRLESLIERAAAHGLECHRLGPDGLKDHEPHVAGVAGIFLPSTGITDYKAISRKYAELVTERGGSIRLGTKVTGVRHESDRVVLSTTAGEIAASMFVNCAGLHSDRMAKMAGAELDAKIVPFRGEYYELAPEARSLVNGLIYPVPNPDFPFLGVHFTRMIDGSVHAGPNAVLALKREGYRKRDISLRDTAETLTYPGFLRLAKKNFGDGMQEVFRSFSKRLFCASLQRLVPELREEDLTPGGAGVRAQAMAPDGALVQDFHFVHGQRQLHVVNAPSPGATASLAIGEEIVRELNA